jgi:hypothetical protein
MTRATLRDEREIHIMTALSHGAPALAARRG